MQSPLRSLPAREVVTHEVRAGGRTIRLLAPRDVESLVPPPPPISGEPRLPFWARVWPGGTALAEFILSGGLGRELEGESVIELGCGLGTAGIAAGLAGAQAVLTDASPEAVAFAAANADLNGLRGVRAARLDWLEAARFGGHHGFRRAIAADVLYDARHIRAFVRALDGVLDRKDGAAYIGDLRRLEPEPFEREARAAGFRVDEVGRVGEMRVIGIARIGA